MVLVVIPIQCYLDVLFPCPITCKFVVFFECILEILCMFFANVFDAEIIDNQCELYGSCVVFFHSPGTNLLCLYPCLLRRFLRIVGQESCLRKAVHATLGSDVDASIFGGFLFELVFSDDFIGDITYLDSDEFGTMKRCHEVEVGNVHCRELCRLHGDDTIEEHLATSISAVGVATLPGQLILLPPTVNCIRLGSAFSGLTENTNCPYAMSSLHSASISCSEMNLIVLVGFLMRPPMPFACRLNFLAADRLLAFL
jgi:hypothetical protein